MTDTLTITPDMVGKYVRLRDGSKAYILAILSEDVLKFTDMVGWHVIVAAEGNGSDFDTYHLDGTFYAHPRDGKSSADIISLWVDEEPKEDNPLIEQAFQRIEALEIILKNTNITLEDTASCAESHERFAHENLREIFHRLKKLEEK